MELVQRSTLDSKGGGSISPSRSPSEAWWSEGKSICLRVKSHDEEYWEFILMPVNCLKQCRILQKTMKRNRKNKKINKIENHSLHHSSPFHLALPKISIQELYEGVYDASWVVLGSLIYFFGAIGESSTDQIYYLRRNLDGTFPASMGVRKAGCLICGRRQPKVVALDGKVYVFGDSDDVFGEVFEPYRDSFEGQSRPLSSPVSSSAHADVLFAVPIDNESKIVVGLKILGSEATVVFVYDVTTDSWVKHNTGFSFNLRSSLCPPIAVDNCLYWLDMKMWAYDLDTRQWFEGPIDDDMFQHILETPVDLQLSLVHLDGDRFCITWVDYHDTTVLHYTTIQVFRTTTRIQGNRFHLRATVFSCESFTSTLSLCLGDRALILCSANVIKKDGDQSSEEAGLKKKKKKKRKGDGTDNIVVVTNVVESEEAAVKKKKKKGDGIDNVVAVTNAVESEEAAVKKKKKKRKGDGIDNFVAVTNAVESEEAAVNKKKKKKKKKKGDGIGNVAAVTNPVDLKTKRKSKEASDLVDEKADKGETVPTKDKTEEKEVSEMVENEGIEKEKKESKKRRKGRRKNPRKEVDNEGVEEEKKESKKRKTSELKNENDVFNFLKKMKKKKSIDLLHHTIDFSSGDEE